jgi:hypothetical protein
MRASPWILPGKPEMACCSLCCASDLTKTIHIAKCWKYMAKTALFNAFLKPFHGIISSLFQASFQVIFSCNNN